MVDAAAAQLSFTWNQVKLAVTEVSAAVLKGKISVILGSQQENGSRESAAFEINCTSLLQGFRHLAELHLHLTPFKAPQVAA